MSDTTANPPSETTYLIDYNLFKSAVYNFDFKGPGFLTIKSDGPTYVFSGKPRGLFTPSSSEIAFRYEDIVNVAITGRTVQFKTELGNSGKKNRPFAFHFRELADAKTVAELLPKTTDTEFTEARDFHAKLDEVYNIRDARLTVTNAVIALNVAVFIIMGTLGAGWFQTESLMPFILYGANNGAATTDGEWWRLLTCTFMHYGILHLLLNMWALFQAGHFVERLLGRWSYLLAYLGSGIAGSLASIAWHGDQTWSAGASGAIFGVYGAIVGYSLRQKQALPKTVFQSMMKSTLGFAGYNILYGFARTGIDNAAHMGGLLGGIALGWLLALPVDAEVRAKKSGRRLQLGLVVLCAVLAAGVALTPRYDYRVKDEIAWQEANREFVGSEESLLKQNQQSLAGVGHGTDETAYVDWLENKLIPLYENWSRKLTGLSLAPGKSTIRTRDALLHIFDLRLQSYRHLAAALKAHDSQAKNQFTAEDAAVVLEIGKLQKSPR